MWARFGSGLIVLAMVASGTTTSQAHLHTANGLRVAHDRGHAGDPAQPLWHTHGADVHTHQPAASSPGHAGDESQPEDVVYIGDTVASSPVTAHWSSPLPVASVLARSTLAVPVRSWASTVGALPLVHAPPLIAPRSPRAPPTFACLYA